MGLRHLKVKACCPTAFTLEHMGFLHPWITELIHSCSRHSPAKDLGFYVQRVGSFDPLFSVEDHRHVGIGAGAALIRRVDHDPIRAAPVLGHLAHLRP